MFMLGTRHLMAVRLVSLVARSTGVYAGAVEQLNAFMSSINIARGEFVQRQVRGGTSGSPLRVAGASSDDFVFSRSGRFVWRYVKPYEQQLSADDQMLYIFDKGLNQITERKLDTPLGSSPVAILFSSNDLAKNFILKKGGIKDNIDWVELTPRVRNTQLQRIAIGSRSDELQGVELHDIFEDTALLTFSNIQKNPQLPVNVFRFTPPKGANVVKR